MGKYLIIDLEKVKKELPIKILAMIVSELDKMNCLLSEEETEAKFKDAWQNGYSSGDGDISSIFAENHWGEYKPKL